jgi:hypothetical protein
LRHVENIARDVAVDVFALLKGIDERRRPKPG